MSESEFDDRVPIIANSEEEREENRAENPELENQPDLEVRIYAKRWYILAVFSILGILQVRCSE